MNTQNISVALEIYLIFSGIYANYWNLGQRNHKIKILNNNFICTITFKTTFSFNKLNDNISLGKYYYRVLMINQHIYMLIGIGKYLVHILVLLNVNVNRKNWFGSGKNIILGLRLFFYCSVRAHKKRGHFICI